MSTMEPSLPERQHKKNYERASTRWRDPITGEKDKTGEERLREQGIELKSVLRDYNPKNPLDLPRYPTLIPNFGEILKWQFTLYNRWFRMDSPKEAESAPATRVYPFWSLRRTPYDGHLHTVGDYLTDRIFNAYCYVYGHPTQQHLRRRVKLERDLQIGRQRLSIMNQPRVEFGQWNMKAQRIWNEYERRLPNANAAEETYLDYMEAVEKFAVQADRIQHREHNKSYLSSNSLLHKAVHGSGGAADAHASGRNADMHHLFTKSIQKADASIAAAA
eukprot:TRINITY_DN1334_c0_g1::TRINITY_DN1334_c0_g1_i1::g.20122::m.20122 TRINITY_DN1334_c0_g1::TRINITY_DN1334_c0_g1_i1::g.20122  ORF type:complete len:286 (+),score=42.86,SYF2/PF08231.7/1.2e+04,SYF2/PF08231.7/0.035 TRINITY_DN1334_c0_g1_i1:34-858(+)